MSGTAEEINRADRLGKPVHVFFSEEDISRADLDTTQLIALQEFRSELEQRGQLGTYGDPRDLGVTSDAAGNLSGVSVNSGRNIEEAAKGIRHGQIGTSTVGAVRDAGGTVVRAPTPYNPGHCLVNGCSAQTLSDLFTPTIKNPWK